MAFRIATNTASINTQRYLGIANAGQAKSLERLSSGYKINKAADDAAGIAIATKLNVKVAANAKSIDNGNQALAMLQTAEGGMDQISNILTRLKELATQSASANTTDRTALDEERTNLEAEINKIAKNTRYGTTTLLQGDKAVAGYGTGITVANGVTNVDVSGASTGNFTMTMSLVTGAAATLTLTDGTTTQSVSVTGLTGLATGVANFSSLGIKITINAAGATIAAAAGGFSVTASTGSFQFQVGDTNATENQITSSLKNFDYNNSAVLALSGGISTSTLALSYMTSVDTAVTNLTTERGKLGAAMNQITYHVANLETMNENTKSAVSTVKDADFAAEMADFTKFQIISQSGIAMLSQANQLPQLVLSLLK
jgi:flagellin